MQIVSIQEIVLLLLELDEIVQCIEEVKMNDEN